MLVRLPVLFAAAAAVLAAQSAPEPASVSGTVVNSVTGEPILRAHVSVRCNYGSQFGDDRLYGVLTNEKGGFVVGPFPPGHCYIAAERVGFVATIQTRAYSLASGEHKDGLKFLLAPAASISGHVLNTAGEPVEGVEIAAGIGYDPNQARATTDDKGEFRIGGLRAAKYRVLASPPDLRYAPEIRADGSREERDASTYYPAALEAAGAQRIDVKPGSTVKDIEIRLARTPVVKLSGRVTGIPAGARAVAISVQPRGQMFPVRADGSFTIWHLNPDKYTLTARFWSGETPLLSAPAEVALGSADIEHIALHLIPPFDVSGDVSFDDEQASQPPQVPGTAGGTDPPPEPHVRLFPADPMSGSPTSAPIAADHSFLVQKATPARYRVTLSGVSGYVRSVRVGETETDGNVLDLRGGPGPVTITVSSNYAEVSGAASDSKGPLTDATVALIAEDMTTWQTVHVTSGAYRFRTPPGRYIVAIVDPDELTLGPRNLDLGEDNSQTVTLTAGEKITQDLVKSR